MKPTYFLLHHPALHEQHLENSAWRAANLFQLCHQRIHQQKKKGQLAHYILTTACQKVKCDVYERLREREVLHEISGPVVN
jgi:hypothetical protein